MLLTAILLGGTWVSNTRSNVVFAPDESNSGELHTVTKNF
jgi:hypothetical protein